MAQFLLLLVVVVIAAGLVFGVVVLATGKDDGLRPVTPDGVSIGLPADRPLSEEDVLTARFDTGARGYRTRQVDDALARLAYDVGFKDELIKVLVSEVQALRDGREDDAEQLRQARAKAIGGATVDTSGAQPDASGEASSQVGEVRSPGLPVPEQAPEPNSAWSEPVPGAPEDDEAEKDR